MRNPTTPPVGATRQAAASRTAEDLVPRDVLDLLIRRECARADRNGREFSLVLFRAKNERRLSVSTQRLARTVMSRARMTDEVGWFSDHYVCTLLPDTASEGAHAFAHGVCDLVARRSDRPMAVVYNYPGNWSESIVPPVPATSEAAKSDRFRDDDDQDHHDGLGAGRRRRSEQMFSSRNGDVADTLGSVGTIGGNVQPRMSVIPTQAGAPLSRADLMPAFAQGLASELQDSGLPAESIHEFLVHPMPMWKRAIDIVGALVVLVLAAPIMIAAALSVKLSSKGPIIFSQKRAGLGGRPFKIYKFRTMVTDAEAKKRELRRLSEQDGPAFKLTNDPRITRFGHILRKTSIDELPQLLNVLKGDMSLVGPRPLPVDESNNCLQWQRRRLDVTPGLTCIWQIKGRSKVTFAEWVRMDVEYIRRRTFMHDLSLMLQTVPAVLMRRGAR